MVSTGLARTPPGADVAHPSCTCRLPQGGDCPLGLQSQIHVAETAKPIPSHYSSYCQLNDSMQLVHDNAEELQRVSRGVPQWHSRSSRHRKPPASSFTGALASMRQLSGTIAYVLEDMERQNEEAQGTQRDSGPPPPPMRSPFNRYGDKKEEERTQGPAVRLPTPKFLPAVVEPPQRRQPRHVCQRCRATETPKWRRGPDGQRSLCNVCGLMFAKQVERVTRR
ncbi:hypothetical protein N3K66_000842 [Trichothecium roseum]|uniref:Uncharacterized protein n=1 Tax=Trichothecium roseum TaxID=47278 RepID=A0ACC0VFR6_9HYPO|nr:hypothetical protein N3K66_000842 [Trichothecium roseum]